MEATSAVINIQAAPDEESFEQPENLEGNNHQDTSRRRLAWKPDWF